MSEFADAKRYFQQEAVLQGFTSEREAPPMAGVPGSRLGKWLRQLRRKPSGEWERPAYPRLINRYMVGADPEFIVEYAVYDGQGRPVKMQPQHASGLGLKTGLAFGADLNGRLAELRPAPSRFAIDVVASTMETLQWMYALAGIERTFQWRAGAFAYRDGMGGHVHLGRKRPKQQREAEVTALDDLCATLALAGVYPKDEMAQRMRETQYGRPGDIRFQSHGYEYRTFPSWLDSPWMAYLTLTLSKLAAYDPKLISADRGNYERSVARIHNLLAYYRGLDDDANIAWRTLHMRGLPKFEGGDFRPRWGIDTRVHAPVGLGAPTVIPTMIEAPSHTVDVLLSHFLRGNKLEWIKFEPTWSPTALPGKDWRLQINKQDTARQIGFGELLWDLVEHRQFGVQITTTERHDAIHVSPQLQDFLPENWRQQINAIYGGVAAVGSSGDGYMIRLGTNLRKGSMLNRTKKVLTSGLFPLWRLRDLQPDSFAKWKAEVDARRVKPEAKAPAKLSGKKIYERMNG